MEQLVSVITPVYNSERYIAETIESILKQSYRNWELLITDDNSDDNSVQIIQRFAEKDSRIKLFRLSENSGADVARNHSIKEAKGRFIAFCDSDDLWLPDKLRVQINFMLDNSYAFTYSNYYSRVEKEQACKVVSFPSRISRRFLLRDNIGCLTVVYDTSVLGKVYMPAIRKRQDWGLWHLLIDKSGYAYGVQSPLAIYRIRKGGMSSNKFDLIKYNIGVYRNVCNYSIFKSYMIFILYYMPTYLLKRIKYYLGESYSCSDVEKK